MQKQRHDSIRQEVINLATLAQQRDKRGRTELYQNISDLMQRDGHDLSETEQTLMCDILRRLTYEVDVAIRQRLAHKLAERPDAPHDLILLLANDDIEIAHPILQQCPALTDKDLMEIVYHKTRQHQLSIASRKMLAEPVSHALVSIGNGPVIVALLNNQTARINEKDFSDIVTRAQNNHEFHEPLLSRMDLPPSLALKMYDWVSSSLRKVIQDNFDLSPKVVGDALTKVVGELHKDDSTRTPAAPNAQSLIDKLYAAGQLKTSFLMKSLSQGEVELFELGFAKMINLNANVMRKILYDRGGDGLAIACRAVGIDRSVFMTIFKLTRQARQMATKISESEMAHAFSFFQNMDQRKAEITVHRWASEESRAPLF